MLKLSTKGRYALRIMVRMGMLRDGGPVRKQTIAKAEGISPDYVEQILMTLKTASLVQSHRGVNGGFSLVKDPAKVTIADILAASEGKMALAPCFTESCERSTSCSARLLWQRASQALDGVFSGTTLADMIRQAEAMEKTKAAPSYEI